ncbi:hypothetical protein D9615_002429 [Tricholomella constricta]|uniref:Uncharacterized protein n=1 Tax=Tricholomella constricta TaxID=117010 RepID=A0A8H5HMY2_9AGAR|nr:hypothetical protein D9615_002429 [Tricholomella constricta]
MISEIQSFVDDNAPRSRFDPQTLILLPPGSRQLPNNTVRQYLHRLALAAEATAAESACSSILAGQGSESDDTGDVALWLGKGDFQTPELVLKGLGLNGEIKMTDFSPPAQLAGLLGELKDAFSFRVQARMTGGVVIFFLLGRVEGAGWGGLAGIAEKVVALEGQIQLLSELHNRLQTLRQIPPLLLKTSITPLSTQALRPEFQQVKEIADTIRTEPVQEALRTARDSLESDSRDLNPNLRRENRKRRRAPSPESPQPYIGQEDKTTSLFPANEDEGPLKFEGLSSYIQDFNSKHEWKLHLWRRTRGLADQATTILRFTIPDVLTAYITLVVATNGVLLTESLTTFSPREKKSPHSQSEFGVYRSLSEQMAQMVQSQPGVGLQGVVGLLCAYGGLFVERCRGCERVLSSEGHVPPVVREWRDGEWAARHVSCKQRC